MSETMDCLILTESRSSLILNSPPIQVTLCPNLPLLVREGGPESFPNKDNRRGGEPPFLKRTSDRDERVIHEAEDTQDVRFE